MVKYGHFVKPHGVVYEDLPYCWDHDQRVINTTHLSENINAKHQACTEPDAR